MTWLMLGAVAADLYYVMELQSQPIQMGERTPAVLSMSS